ncbi:MAG: alpha/beta hydrolase [Acidocella sp.]|nr:alpha/beta hydrolase [Acidocella sp.]
MSLVTHRFVEANGIKIHVAEQGEGPVVLLCHGFPESWYSWRHQMRALAQAGFRAIAPDMRGYGQTGRPVAIEDYTIFHLVGDMVGLLDALGVAEAVIAGHDWGAPVAWSAAMFRPDRFRAVMGLSVPYRPRGLVPPTSRMPKSETAMFYQLYFQEPGLAEAAMAADVRGALHKLLYASSAEGFRGGVGLAMVNPDKGYLAMPLPDRLPAWLDEADLDFYTREFSRTGFAGALNWYRNIDRNWALTGAFAKAPIRVPALYMAGDKDLVTAFPGMDKVIATMGEFVPDLRGKITLSECGHWTQQERPDEVNAAMLAFLHQLS